MATGRRWTHDELVVALNIYHKLTFGQLHSRHPAIIDLAGRLDRGANSVAMKLCNFASLDPALRIRGIRGLEGASALDRTVWAEFHQDLNETVPASEEALRLLFGTNEESELEVLPKEGIRIRKRPPGGPTESVAQVKQRRGQEFFRDAVLNNFGGRCGVTGLAIRELLIASHILPWGSHPEERLNVRNGLSLSRLHDAAFDRGLISFDDNLRLLLSPRLKGALEQKSLADNFAAYEGEPLRLPDDAALPEIEFLSDHRSAWGFPPKLAKQVPCAISFQSDKNSYSQPASSRAIRKPPMPQNRSMKRSGTAGSPPSPRSGDGEPAAPER